MKALFLDRDGVINVDHGYVSKIENFTFIDGIFELCKKAILNGYEIIVVTNQTGIALKKYSLDDFLTVNKYMLDIFKNNGINILDVFYCPHNPNDNCFCHKPNPGMILEAQKKYNIDLDKSIIIGDKESDCLAGYNAKVKNIYLFNGKDDVSIPCYKISSLMEVKL